MEENLRMCGRENPRPVNQTPLLVKLLIGIDILQTDFSFQAIKQLFTSNSDLENCPIIGLAITLDERGTPLSVNSLHSIVMEISAENELHFYNRLNKNTTLEAFLQIITLGQVLSYKKIVYEAANLMGPTFLELPESFSIQVEEAEQLAGFEDPILAFLSP